MLLHVHWTRWFFGPWNCHSSFLSFPLHQALAVAAVAAASLQASTFFACELKRSYRGRSNTSKEMNGKHRLKHLGRSNQRIQTRHWISQIHFICPHVCSPLALTTTISLNQTKSLTRKHHEILHLVDWHLYQLSQDLNCFSLGQLLFALSRKSIYLVQLDSYGNILNIL